MLNSASGPVLRWRGVRGASARAARAKLAVAKHTAVHLPAPVARCAAGDTRFRLRTDFDGALRPFPQNLKSDLQASTATNNLLQPRHLCLRLCQCIGRRLELLPAIKTDNKPPPAIFWIAPILFESICSVLTHEDVDTSRVSRKIERVNDGVLWHGKFFICAVRWEHIMQKKTTIKCACGSTGYIGNQGTSVHLGSAFTTTLPIAAAGCAAA